MIWLYLRALPLRTPLIRLSKLLLVMARKLQALLALLANFLAEEDIKDAVNKKKNSPLTAITGGDEGDWEEFQALENIKQKLA